MCACKKLLAVLQERQQRRGSLYYAFKSSSMAVSDFWWRSLSGKCDHSKFLNVTLHCLDSLRTSGLCSDVIS